MLECAIHPITYRGDGILATVVKFDSIVQNVQQNLVQSEFIYNNVLVFDIDHINRLEAMFG